MTCRILWRRADGPGNAGTLWRLRIFGSQWNGVPSTSWAPCRSSSRPRKNPSVFPFPSWSLRPTHPRFRQGWLALDGQRAPGGIAACSSPPRCAAERVSAGRTRRGDRSCSPGRAGSAFEAQGVFSSGNRGCNCFANRSSIMRYPSSLGWSASDMWIGLAKTPSMIFGT